MIHRALEAGINFVDTCGELEETAGKSRRGSPRSPLLANGRHTVDARTDLNMRGNWRRWIVQEVEASLVMLQTDWIDLYQIHRQCRDLGTEENGPGALTDLQRAGKASVRPRPASAIVEGQWVAEKVRLASSASSPLLDPRTRHRQ